MMGSGKTPSGERRQCVQCGTMETPLWRTGPMGPKTFCNACGVRWKKQSNASAANGVGVAGIGVGGPSQRVLAKKERSAPRSVASRRPSLGASSASVSRDARDCNSQRGSASRSQSDSPVIQTRPSSPPVSADDMDWEAVVMVTRKLNATNRSKGNPSALMAEEYRRSVETSTCYERVFSGLMAGSSFSRGQMSSSRNTMWYG